MLYISIFWKHVQPSILFLNCCIGFLLVWLHLVPLDNDLDHALIPLFDQFKGLFGVLKLKPIGNKTLYIHLRIGNQVHCR